MIQSELMALLVCPACRCGLQPTPEGDGLVCEPCAVVYPITDGIPILLIEEAVPKVDWANGEKQPRM